MNTNQTSWRFVGILSQWVRAFWLVALVVGAGWTVFRAEVVQSIESTPHPALVYAIFAVAGFAVLLCAQALWRYGREESWLMALRATAPQDRLDGLRALNWRPDLAPACVALLDHPGQAQVQQAVIENELYVCEERLLSHLTLPGYLSGALVGLGLVGTFIGLLGALADLGALFSSLTQMGGQDADPVAMFASMLNQLQEPMRGMGTAFVASLYGLLGSLVLGLVIHSVRKSGMRVMGQVHALVRQVTADEARAALPTSTDARTDAEGLASQPVPVAHALGLQPQDVQHHLTLLAALGETARAGHAELQALREGLAPALAQLIAAQHQTAERVLEINGHMAVQGSALKTCWKALARRQAPTLIQMAVTALVSGVVAALAAAGVTWALVSHAAPAAAPIVAPAPNALEVGSQEATAPATVSSGPMQAQGAVMVREVTVVEGQTLSQTARQAGISLAALLEANPQLTVHSRLLIGQVIRVPQALGAPSVAP